MTQPIGIAIAGMGKIARDSHVPAIRGDARFALLASVDPHGGIAGVANHDDLTALLADRPDIVAVSVCTPPQVRGSLARAAIAAGRHVLLEKPPAATLGEFRALADLAAEAGVTLFTAWHSRHAAMVDSARDWLKGRTVAGGHVHWRENVRQWHPGQRWLWAPGGLGVFDPAINAFSILTAILPEPPTVRSATLQVPENAQTPIAGQLVFAAGAGELAIDLDFLQTGTQTWDIVLETACGHRLALGKGGATMAIDDGATAEAPKNHGEYPGLYAHFADLIDAGRSDADAAPLRLVADALLVASVERVAPFIE